MFEVKLNDDAYYDFEEMFMHYNNISEGLSQKFIIAFDETVLKLSDFPYFQIRYANIRLRQVKNFPVMLHFIVYDDMETVVIYGVRFGQQNPENYPNP